MSLWREEEGWTLIELVLVILLLVILAVVVSSSFHSYPAIKLKARIEGWPQGLICGLVSRDLWVGEGRYHMASSCLFDEWKTVKISSSIRRGWGVKSCEGV